MEKLVLQGAQNRQHFRIETVEDRAKVTTNGLYKVYTGFRLPPKCMTFNDL